LERLSLVQMHYYQKETVELVRLNSCDLVESQFSLASDYPSGVALDYIAELSEQLLPSHEPNEKFFRLLVSVLQQLRSTAPVDRIWLPITYFSLWAVRLSGFLEEMRIEDESLAIAKEMLTKPVSQLDARAWTKETAQDLRRALIRSVEIHIERRLMTARVLETL
jgi:DNA repair protein RecO (recombination protein O)